MPIVSKIVLGVSPLPTSQPRRLVSEHAGEIIVPPPVNHAPTYIGSLVAKDFTTADAGTGYQYALNPRSWITEDVLPAFNDIDGDILAISVSGSSRVSIDVLSGHLSIRFDTTGLTVGSYNFTIRATDPGGLYAEHSFTTTVTAVVIVSCDPYWGNVKLLMSLTGPAGAVTSPTDTHLIDESPAAHGLASTSLQSNTFTATSVLGYPTSMSMPGGGSRITFGDSGDWNLFNRKYTIEYWFRPATTAFAFHIAQWSDFAGDLGWVLDSGTNYAMSVSTTGSDSPVNWSGGVIAANTWYPACAEFDGTKYRAYINGVMVASSTTPRTVFNSTQTLNIGAGQLGAFPFAGNMQEIRVTMDVARYASDTGYTPTTVPFPRSACATCGQAAAFLARTSGLDATHTDAYIALICGLVADGVWPLLDVLYVYATQNSTTALLNLVQNRFNGVIHGTPAFTADRGFTGTDSSTTTYIATGFNHSVELATSRMKADAAHLSLWSLTDATNNHSAVGAGTADGLSTYNIFPRFSDGNSYYRVVSGAFGGPVPVSDPRGHFIASRTGGTVNCVHNGVGLGGILDTIKTPANLELYTTASNGESGSSGSGIQVAAVSWGYFLSAPQSTSLFNRLCTYMNAVSGNTICNFMGWDPATSNTALSNNNLTSTYNVVNGVSRVAAMYAKTSGKHYFEITWAVLGGFINGGTLGVGLTTATFSELVSGTNSVIVNQGDFSNWGQIRAGGVFTGYAISPGAMSAGTVIGIALDLDNKKVWFRVSPSGLWNGNGTANPVTGVNGVTVPTGSIIPVGYFNTNADTYILNAGATAFSGAVPSGYASGWLP